jgi:hypothetical protein
MLAQGQQVPVLVPLPALVDLQILAVVVVRVVAIIFKQTLLAPAAQAL